ncbi:sialate O-acetylesterase [Pirellulales bacterium]|nr:sialate O-acetylesterase [Pirellulales bacterium]
MVGVGQAADDSRELGSIWVDDGGQDQRVYQRDSDGTASVSIGGRVEPTRGVQLRFRVLRRDQVVDSFDWAAARIDQNGSWTIQLTHLQTGGPYRLELELLDHEAWRLDQRTSESFFVGDLWVLAGQSNMDGCGSLDSDWVQSPSEGVCYFSLANSWRIAEEPLHYCYESAYPVYLTTYAPASPTGRAPIEYRPRGTWPDWRPEGNLGAGLGLPFAKLLYEKTGVPIGLVLCSLGGTTMAHWSPALKVQGGESLYGALLDRVARVGGKLSGILWWQGESEHDSKDYRANMQNLIGALRRDLARTDLPFLLVQLGPQEVSGDVSPTERVRIREIQRRLAHDLPNVHIVTAIDQKLSSSAHVDTEGYTRIGWRLSRIALSTCYHAKDISIGPRVVRAWREEHDVRLVHVQFDHVNGGLLPSEQIKGFSLRSFRSSDRTNRVLQALRHPTDASRIVIHAEAPADDDLCLWYAYGWTPRVNLTDQRDMACLAFGPLAIEGSFSAH